MFRNILDNLNGSLDEMLQQAAETKKECREADKLFAEAMVMVANAEADLAKAEADHRRVEAECAEKLKELDADRKRSETISAEINELMAIRPMTPEIRYKCMQLMKQLTNGGAV